jgi:hypothetical protein
MNTRHTSLHLPSHCATKFVKQVPVVVLSESEPLRVFSADGQPLLEISYDGKAPAIRLAQDDVRFECSGALDLAARSITMSATEDVTVQGRTIRLN